MKATVLALALAFTGAALAQAPTPPSPATKAAHEAQMMNDLAVLLDLNASQKSQVQTILQARHAAMEGQHAQMKQEWEAAKASGTKPDFAQMKAAHEQFEQETLQQLSPVLNSSQLAKFQILQKMRDHEHFHHHRGPPPGAAGAPQK